MRRVPLHVWLGAGAAAAGQPGGDGGDVLTAPTAPRGAETGFGGSTSSAGG